MPSLSKRIKDRCARLRGEDPAQKDQPVTEGKTKVPEPPKKKGLFGRKKQ